jgi:hypothetical protein
MPERKTMFEEFWNAWPKSIRKGGKPQCRLKWDKLKLEIQADQIIKHVEWMKTTEQWKRDGGNFIPAPLVYINQMRWEGAEVPEMTLNVNVNFKDPALAKIEEDTKNVAPMPSFVRDYINRLTKK